ncbi:hypothetical protein HZH68_006781 [Vespula germanica]|uniref:Uncharacterized protein n=1 Tax=Vespula germanica TaxID=30212 RepID=A0A834KC68_VESGE|nr:hypothetical protein HZH68_006781 [Vespula germanica]
MCLKKICQVSPLILVQLNVIITVILIVSVKAYTIPEPLFEVLGSKGLRISIEDAPGLQYFTFHGNLNKAIYSGDPGELFGDVFRAKNGRWTLEKANVFLQEGDVVNYWIYVQVNNTNSIKENQRYVVGANSKKSTTVSPVIVNPSTTKEQLIFSEDFNNLDESLWSRDIKMPLEPDYEFCVYHNDNHQKLVEIDNGILRINPIILEDSYGENITAYGTLQLADCTSNVPQECFRNALSYSILPPVISARFNTKNRFAFKYGKIEIRAKFPEGDWLYPELWLEPLYSLYGPNYASGRVLLGFARGNDNLVDAENLEKIYDARKLEFGLRSGSPTIYEDIVQKTVDRDSKWNKDFHVYTTIWDANGFKFLADGEEIGRLLPTVNGWLHNNNSNVHGMTKIAPFDQEFYISIGIGVGGLRVFPDKTISSGYKKPWKNVGAKPMLQFWHSRSQWLPSWRRDNSKKRALEIDYVKVWSCIASAELIKMHVPERSTTRSISSNIGKHDINETSTIQRNDKRIKSRGDDRQYFISTNFKDTPLKTVNIQAVQKDKPLIFQKKYQLPELQHNVPSKAPEISTNIITIKSSPEKDIFLSINNM